MYFLSYLFKFMPLYFISHFSSWLGLACIVMFLIFIVHSYVAPTLNKLNIIYNIYRTASRTETGPPRK